jgi:hypothetical protein
MNLGPDSYMGCDGIRRSLPHHRVFLKDCIRRHEEEVHRQEQLQRYWSAEVVRLRAELLGLVREIALETNVPESSVIRSTGEALMSLVIGTKEEV